MLQSIALSCMRQLGRMRWLRRGLRERAIRALQRALVPADTHFRTRLGAFEYSGQLNNLIDWNVHFYGIYEPELVALFEHVASQSNSCAVDVGANVGHHSLILSRLFKTVEAFEPWAKVRERLAQHIQRNKITNVRVHPVALGATDSVQPFFVPPDSNLGQGSLMRGHTAAAQTTPIEVTVRRADQYLASIEAKDPSLVKIDVEGYEGQVLQGMQATLKRARPIVIFELSDSTRKLLKSRGDLETLFPPAYFLFSIAFRQVVLGLFERTNIQLLNLDFSSFSGNAIAIPGERATQFSGLIPQALP